MLLVDVAGGARLCSSEGWNQGAVTFERTPMAVKMSERNASGSRKNRQRPFA